MPRLHISEDGKPSKYLIKEALEMLKKHRVRINIKDEGGDNQRVLEGADIRLPSRIVRWLFGDFTTVYLLKPGQSIESVEVHELNTAAE